MCLLSFLKWGSIGYPLGIVQCDFTRRDHSGNPGRVSGSGPVNRSFSLAMPPVPPPLFKLPTWPPPSHQSSQTMTNRLHSEEFSYIPYVYTKDSV